MITLLTLIACQPVEANRERAADYASGPYTTEGAEDTGAPSTQASDPNDTAAPIAPLALSVELLELDTAPSVILDIVETLGRVLVLGADGTVLDVTDDSALPTEGGALATSLLWRRDGAQFCAQVHRPDWLSWDTELACWNDLGELTEQGAPAGAHYFGQGLGHLDGVRLVLEGGDADAPSALWSAGEKVADWWPAAGPYGSQLAAFDGRSFVAAAGYIVELDPDTNDVVEIFFPGGRTAVETLGPTSATIAEEFFATADAVYYTSTISGTTRLGSEGWSSPLVGGSGEDATTVFWPTELRPGEVWATGRDGQLFLLDSEGSIWSGAVYDAEAACALEGSMRVWPVDDDGEFVWACRGTNTWGRSRIVEGSI